MRIIIPALETETSESAASDWLRRIIAEIGPCFQFDTSPEDYTQSDGKPLFSEAECKRLAEGLDLAFDILGQNIFEDVCLRGVWEQLGVRFDERLDQLVPATS